MKKSISCKAKWIALFPGQGVWPIPYIENSDVTKSFWDKVNKCLSLPISHYIETQNEGELRKPKNLQPAIVATSYALFQTLIAQGWSKPYAFAGHSLGEYTALAASNTWNAFDVIKFLGERGVRMTCPELGGMAIVLNMSLQELKIFLHHECFIANDNGESQVVISGTHKGLQVTIEKIKSSEKKGIKIIPLDVQGPYHSPLMSHAASLLTPSLNNVTLKKPYSPIIMNYTAKAHRDTQSIQANLIHNTCHGVRWRETMETIISYDVDYVVDIGPGSVMAGLMKRSGFKGQIISISSMADVQEYEVTGRQED